MVSSSSSAMRERSSITPMKMNSGIASSTSLVITPKMRCGSAPRMPKPIDAERVAEHGEGERHAGERQRHRIAGHQRAR